MLQFSKMHGIGNDYVYMYCPEGAPPESEELAKRISDRRFGVGGDGLILILPSERADFRMQMFNEDGSEGKMCGNGIRCVGKYVYDKGLTDKRALTIDTASGIKELTLFVENGKVETVEVDMGRAIFAAKEIPMATELPDFIARTIEVQGKSYTATAVSMGNPHLVLFGGDPEELELAAIGPSFERHPLFPERVNTEFIQVIDAQTLKMRVWERGSGETLACGTGACAAVAAAVKNDYCSVDKPVTVHLRGGDLVVTYQKDGTVRMKGSATLVFDGETDAF